MEKMRQFKKMMKKEKGFTLVELLAVIVILAIILAIAVPSIGNIISNSKEDAHKANVDLFENAARLADVSGDFVADENGGMSLESLVNSGYLEERPDDPRTDEEDQYNGSVTKYKNGPEDENPNKVRFECSDASD